MSLPRILVVDDEEVMRDVLGSVLGGEGYSVRFAATGPDAIAELKESPVDAVILDLMLPGMSGLEVLDELKRMDENLPVLMLTAQASIETAISAMKKGAFDYVTKPFKHDELLILLQKALQQSDLVDENRSLKLAIRPQGNFLGLVGKSPKMEQVYALIQQAGPARTTVLINGESGTGKELVARAIHDLSPRKGRPFVAINCGAIAESLLESEMFGHVKGAFTDARQSRAGVIEQAHQGSLLLDEIGEMSLGMQVKLLRVIQERRVRRVGGSEETPVDVRIIAATHRDLTQMVREGTFREDLYYRIDVIQVPLPPLRERLDDIPLLVAEFSARLFRQGGFPRRSFSPAAMAALMRHTWPGNVRELENVVERALTLAAGDTVDPDHLSLASPARDSGIPDPYPGFSLQDHLSRTELHLVRRAMEIAGDRRPEAAQLLGVSARALKYLLSKLAEE